MDSSIGSEYLGSRNALPALISPPKLPFSRQISYETVLPGRFKKKATIDRSPRSVSSHQVHELSDVREVSGSSRGGPGFKRPSTQLDDSQGVTPVPPSHNLEAARPITSPSECAIPRNPLAAPKTPPKGLGSRVASAMSLPLREVPERRSSASVLGQSVAGSRQGSLQDFPSWKLPSSVAAGQTIPSRGRAESPVRGASMKGPVSSDLLRSSTSRTFIRTAAPLDILENGSSRHSRVDMRVRLPSPLFVGGGTIEGQISLKIDGAVAPKTKAKPIFISRLSIDVIGVEEVSDGRQWTFLSLASELFDADHAPPASLVYTKAITDGAECFWQLKPSSVVIPFCLNLPLNLGPPPYLSKQAAIRYLFCPTVVVKVGSRKSIIRQTWNIQMLTVHDPEKALVSLPSPLLASDTLSLSQGTEVQSIRLTAGLHRQTWVNGAAIFVDIHVANNSAKVVKKLELQLEKTTLWYAHAAAGTAERSASYLRLPRKSDNETVSTTVMKRSKYWAGVPSHGSEVRTCEINAPRGHVTISTGRYFEVRYFLNVIVSISMFKTVAVQLPVTLIHINSLDIMPNALAQVAASIEAKRARTVPVREEGLLYPLYHQGRAFTAPQRLSLEQARNARQSLAKDEICALSSDLNDSPRRYARFCHGHHRTLSTMISSENVFPGRPDGAPTFHHHHMQHPDCYHCHLLHDVHARKSSSVPPGPKLPRLQVSTSGLGFSDSDFEVSPEQPLRKVMLSEKERKTISLQRELNMQRKGSLQDQRRQSIGDNAKERHVGQRESQWGWKNVAAAPNAEPRQHAFGNRSVCELKGRPSDEQRTDKTLVLGKDILPGRSRSRTNPERFPTMPAQCKHRRGPHSMEKMSRGPLQVDGMSRYSMGQPRVSRDKKRNAVLRPR